MGCRKISAFLVAISPLAATFSDAQVRLFTLGYETPAPFNVAAAGDLNGDGRADFYTATQTSGGVGLVYAISGANGSILWSRQQQQGYARMGSGLVSIGDISGDGVADVAVGTPRQNVGSLVRAGRVEVLSGSDGLLLFRIEGNQAGGSFGATITSVGDIDLDQVPDLVACAPGRDIQLPPSAASYCAAYSGLTGAELYRVVGETSATGLGTALVSIPDVNADGSRDFIVSKEASVAGASADGAVQIRSGNTGVLLAERIGTPGTRFGSVLSALGDIDGDGRQEVAVTSRNNSNAGPTTVFSLNSPISTSGLLATFIQRFSYSTTQRASASAAIRDMNGDGVRDIVVGFSRVSMAAAPALTLLSGSTGQAIGTIANVTNADTFGSGLANIGDVNNDGVAEFAVIGGGPANISTTSVYSPTALAKVAFGCNSGPGHIAEILGSVTIGSTITFRGRLPGAANSLGLLVVGIKPTEFAGVDFDLQPNRCRTGAGAHGTGYNYVMTDANGEFSLPFTIPNDPSLRGFEIYFEAWGISAVGSQVFSGEGVVARVQ